MRTTLLLLGALALLASPTLAAKPPLVQDNTNHHYYAVRLEDLDLASPHDLAQQIGVEYVGQVGELSNYHLFSYPKTIHEKRSLTSVNNTIVNGEHQDIVIRRYEALRQSDTFAQHLRKRGLDLEGRQPDQVHPLGPIHKQFLRQRIKRAMPMERRDEHIQGDAQPADIAFAGRFQIRDPGFGYQWHLHNTLQKGNDINVTGVWDQNITGKGAIVAIIDDGLDANSEDLTANFHAAGSHDFNDNVDIPLPRLDDDNHGTRCAGEIASMRNDLCGVGVAWDAKVAGLRILSGEISDVQEAEALNYGFQETQIYSCSWGPRDDGKSMDGPTGLLREAFINGVNNGRGGKGSIFVFATGNGGRSMDNCNFDGYTNSRYTVSIGAITRTNQHPVYSEACSAQLGVTYSSGDNSWIYTCDVGKRNCYGGHSGTSAAAPIAAAIYALVLEVRPDLNWRDIQYLTVHTSLPIDESDPDWKETSVGRLFNHKYGYGSLDAYAMVEAAKTWVSVGAQVTYDSPVAMVNGEIPSGESGIPSVIDVTEAALKGVKFGTLEHVTVTVTIHHHRRGEVEVELRSPDNIVSNLAVARPADDSVDGFDEWTFMSVKHWEENPIGKWTLTVYDRQNINNTGVFTSWRLGLHGEIEGGHASTPVPPPALKPTTSAALPAETGAAGKKPEGGIAIKISPFIYIMFAGMFVAIGAAMFLMYRQRTNPRSMFASGIHDEEEAVQRGGLLGRRGDYEFDELPTHELGDSDEDDDEDPRGHRIVFDRSNIVDSDHEEGMKEVKTTHLTDNRSASSPLSSGEEIERESSFEVAGDAEREEEDDVEEEDDDDFEDHPGGSGSKVRKGSWDEFSTLVKKTEGKSRR